MIVRENPLREPNVIDNEMYIKEAEIPSKRMQVFRDRLINLFGEENQFPMIQDLGQHRAIDYNETDHYFNDHLGLRSLEKVGKLIKLHLMNGHDDFEIKDMDMMFARALNL